MNLVYIAVSGVFYCLNLMYSLRMFIYHTLLDVIQTANYFVCHLNKLRDAKVDTTFNNGSAVSSITLSFRSSGKFITKCRLIYFYCFSNTPSLGSKHEYHVMRHWINKSEITCKMWSFWDSSLMSSNLQYFWSLWLSVYK